jgi:hypothetical protein
MDSIRHSLLPSLHLAVGNEGEVLDILTPLVENPDLRKRVRRKAHQKIHANRTRAGATADRFLWYAHMVDSQEYLSSAGDAAIELLPVQDAASQPTRQC